MKLIPIDPNEFPTFREGRRGRVSYPLLKSFLETNQPLCMLDRTGMQQSLQSLTSSLGAYIRSHSLPINLMTRGGQIYLARTDSDGEGQVQAAKPIDQYRIDAAMPEVFAVAPPSMSAEVVQTRFEEERHKADK